MAAGGSGSRAGGAEPGSGSGQLAAGSSQTCAQTSRCTCCWLRGRSERPGAPRNASSLCGGLSVRGVHSKPGEQVSTGWGRPSCPVSTGEGKPSCLVHGPGWNGRRAQQWAAAERAASLGGSLAASPPPGKGSCGAGVSCFQIPLAPLQMCSLRWFLSQIESPPRTSRY